jgi:alpha-L-arabinofuranosidase
LILKISNPGAATRAAIELAGVTGVAPRAKAFVLQGEKPTEVNSLDQPRKLAPVETEWAVAGPRFERAFPAHSFSVLRIKTR